MVVGIDLAASGPGLQNEQPANGNSSFLTKQGGLGGVKGSNMEGRREGTVMTVHFHGLTTKLMKKLLRIF